MDKKQIFVIGGPNGAGKTTSAVYLLPDIMDNAEFVNADSIAAGISPFNPDSVAIQAGRLMLKRIKELANKQISFAFETTMASKSFLPFLKKCRNNEFEINSIYMSLEEVKLAVNRVKERVLAGGHNIPEETIERRYYAGLKNFFDLYMSISDNWFLYNNSQDLPVLTARKIKGNDIEIVDNIYWNKIKEKIK